MKSVNTLLLRLLAVFPVDQGKSQFFLPDQYHLFIHVYNVYIYKDGYLILIDKMSIVKLIDKMLNRNGINFTRPLLWSPSMLIDKMLIVLL